jgi:hypothetical protein
MYNAAFGIKEYGEGTISYSLAGEREQLYTFAIFNYCFMKGRTFFTQAVMVFTMGEEGFSDSYVVTSFPTMPSI